MGKNRKITQPIDWTEILAVNMSDLLWIMNKFSMKVVVGLYLSKNS